jgi:hypothetical protein
MRCNCQAMRIRLRSDREAFVTQLRSDREAVVMQLRSDREAVVMQLLSDSNFSSISNDAAIVMQFEYNFDLFAR